MNWETIEAHIEAGTLVPRSRVTVDDLYMAATWLEAYEYNSDEADNSTPESLAAVAQKLRREAARREKR